MNHILNPLQILAASKLLTSSRVRRTIDGNPGYQNLNGRSGRCLIAAFEDNWQLSMLINLIHIPSCVSELLSARCLHLQRVGGAGLRLPYYLYQYIEKQQFFIE